MRLYKYLYFYAVFRRKFSTDTENAQEPVKPFISIYINGKINIIYIYKYTYKYIYFATVTPPTKGGAPLARLVYNLYISNSLFSLVASYCFYHIKIIA